MPNRNIVSVSFLMLSEEESSELPVLNPNGVKKKTTNPFIKTVTQLTGLQIIKFNEHIRKI